MASVRFTAVPGPVFIDLTDDADIEISQVSSLIVFNGDP